MLEFALTLPIVLTLVMYGLETANFGLSILRVHQIAALSADNAARVRDSITEADINEVLTGGKIIGEKMDFANRGRIVLSGVVPNDRAYTTADPQQTILWQRCAGKLNTTESQPKYGAQDKGKTDASLLSMGTGTRTIATSANTAMVFAEVTYQYKPLISTSFIGTPILRSEASFSVRERSAETPGPGSSGTISSICTRYDL